jgi:NAD(P)-dependent dehydrogenase (short-subunit alcohol dehydrogenase family)
VAAAAIAVALAEAGADIGMTTATENPEEALLLKRLALRLSESRRKSLAEILDLGDLDALQAAFRRLTAALSGLDILVVSTDSFQDGPTERLRTQDWSRLVERNLGSVLFACQAGLREMAGRPPGSDKGRIIVLIHEPRDHAAAAYMALRHAVDGLVPALAWEWEPAPVTVNGIGIPRGAPNNKVIERAMWLVQPAADPPRGQITWV